MRSFPFGKLGKVLTKIRPEVREEVPVQRKGSYQDQTRNEGGSAGERHIEFGRQSVQKHCC